VWTALLSQMSRMNVECFFDRRLTGSLRNRAVWESDDVVTQQTLTQTDGGSRSRGRDEGLAESRGGVCQRAKNGPRIISAVGTDLSQRARRVRYVPVKSRNASFELRCVS
jgi:hypothetical protein